MWRCSPAVRKKNKPGTEAVRDPIFSFGEKEGRTGRTQTKLPTAKHEVPLRQRKKKQNGTGFRFVKAFTSGTTGKRSRLRLPKVGGERRCHKKKRARHAGDFVVEEESVESLCETSVGLGKRTQTNASERKTVRVCEKFVTGRTT